jgi:MFS family permease
MRWRIVPFMMVFVALAHFNRLSISVAGAERIIPSDLLNPTQMGLVYSAYLVVYTLFMIPGGWFIDRFGPRRAWMAVGFGSAAGAALTGWVGLTWTEAGALLAGLLAARSLMGMVNAPLHPCGARLVANWVPTHQVALTNGLLTGAAVVGIASTPLVFGALMDAIQWPRAFLYAGGVTLVVAFGWTILGGDRPLDAATVEKEISHEQAVGARHFARLMRNPSLLWLTLSYGTVGYFEYLFFYWSQYYFEQVLKLGKGDSRLYTGLLNLSMAAGMVVGGWLSDRAMRRFGPFRGLAAVPVGGLLIGAAVTVLGALATQSPVIVASFAIAMAAVGSTEGAFWTAAVGLGGRMGGSAAGILNTGGNAVGLLAPALTPVISHYFGWKAGLGVSSIVCVAGAAMWWGVVSLTDPLPESKEAP